MGENRMAISGAGGVGEVCLLYASRFAPHSATCPYPTHRHVHGNGRGASFHYCARVLVAFLAVVFELSLPSFLDAGERDRDEWAQLGSACSKPISPPPTHT